MTRQIANPLADYWQRTLEGNFNGRVVALTYTDGTVRSGKLQRTPNGSWTLDGALLVRPPGAQLQSVEDLP